LRAAIYFYTGFHHPKNKPMRQLLFAPSLLDGVPGSFIIAGFAIILLVVLALIALIILLVRFLKKRKQNQQSNHQP
jgi:hypothetical protein